MKITYWESDFGLEMELIPETLQEISELTRFALNAKAEKPEINMNFSTPEPKFSIWMKKIKKSVQTNSVYPKFKK